MTRLLTKCLTVWAILLAGITSFAGAGTALRFNGVNSDLNFAGTAFLHAYPLTVSVWFRTRSTSGAPQVIVAKYLDSLYNGWSLQVESGVLHGYFFRNGLTGDYAINAYTAGSVNDGAWHYAALVVDTNGGRIYLDGNLAASSTWTGAKGPESTPAMINVGALAASGSYPFNGDIDEVAVWNRSLTANEVNHLKFRQLQGNEDGLLAYWRMDEGAGSTVSDSSASHSYPGTLLNNPVWVSSGAPVVLSNIATNCLKLAGTGDYVSISDAPDLDAYPFTVSAWIKTSLISAAGEGIVSKYVNSSKNGFSLFMVNGHVRAWYFADGNDYIWDQSLGLDGGLVADGDWHHLAFTVDITGGSLIVDGNLIQHLPWTGNPGPPASTTPLQIGRYDTYANSFPGQIDEVTLWNTSFTASQVQAMKNLPLMGSESGLVGYWRFDEGSGAQAGDSTGNNHTGTLNSSATWTGSTAFLGDGQTYLAASEDYAQADRLFAIAGSPGQSAFTLDTSATLTRIYDYGTAPAAEPVSGALNYSLASVPGATDIPLNASEADFNTTLGASLADSPRVSGAANGWYNYQATVNAEPDGVQLDSVDNSHQYTVILSHTENGGAQVFDETNSSAVVKLLHFDGNLFAGGFQAAFTNIAGYPVVTNTVPGDHLDCQLAISLNGGYIPGFAGYNFGAGAALPVALSVNGDATLENGYYLTTTPANTTDSIQNISFQRSQVLLFTNGAFAAFSVDLPVGFSRGLTDTSSRLTTNVFLFYSYLDASLHPNTNTLTFTGNYCYSIEGVPCWLLSPQLIWQVDSGQLVVPATSVQYVRQFEDDVLTANSANLVDVNSAHRISNDGYFRNASLYAPSPGFTVTADTNGIAQITGNINLNPPELRPHFPYTDENPGSEISTGSGLLALQYSLAASNSLLYVTAPVPLAYARDCTDTNCSGATIAPATTQILPAGGQLNFTPDGGLLGYGPVDSINNPVGQSGVALTWGYAGGANFAQQTSYVLNGAYHMPGNFLRGDQTSLDGTEKPAVLLFSGWGNDSDPAYRERPGTPDYLNGYGNYAGLNLRAPDQGDSYIANTDTGWYPLTTRAKYYARIGGVSGIHESATFPASLPLYGYNFTFSTYRLSFLDSDNYESRTDGEITFPPQPAGFAQGFERMKFFCSGGLDSAQLPASSTNLHLNYWNADFKPLSLQFSAQNDASCVGANRFLVIGAEVYLPFVPQALHGSLGFWPSGNLTTVADNLALTDSRFPVPGQMNIQATENKTFPLGAASDGYFNNWATENHPTNGFFNLIGTISVPFFTGIKSHLHITPITSTTAQVDIMGGWPATGNNAADQGWSDGTNNFFTVAKFDPNSDGWPTSVPIGSYRNSNSEKYHPRAQRNWHGVVIFDYPTTYNPALHRFEGFAKAPVELPIVRVDSNLKKITPTSVDLDFAQDISLKLPVIKGLDFLNDTADEINAPFNSISNAIYGELQDISDKTGLSRGFQSMQRMLSDEASGFFGPSLDASLDPVAQSIANALAAGQSSDPNSVLTNVFAAVNDAGSGVQSAISRINGTVNQVNSVIGQVNQTFTDVDDTLGLLQRVVQKDPQGQRHIIRVIVQKLIQDQAGDTGLPSALADNIDSGVLDTALADIDPTLDEISQEIGGLRQDLQDAHGEISNGTGDISDVLNSVTNDAGAVSQFVTQSQIAVSNLLVTAITPTGDYFKADPLAAQAAIKRKLEAAFLSSSIPGDYQKDFRQFFSDDNYVLDQLLTVLTDQINSAVRSSIENYLEGANDGVYAAMKGIGAMQSMATAKIRGQATFNGDSLRLIHLDAKIQLNLPKPMTFPVYMEIAELDSQSGNLACIPGGDEAEEVTLGAKNVPLQWPGADSGGGLTLTANARWTLQNSTVVGIGGLLEVDGNASFSGCSLKTIGATMAIGQTDNYFAAKADATALIGPVPVEFKAGIFAGQACSLDPLLYVDTNALSVLSGATSFSGIYIQFGGDISLSQLLFGTSSCLLDVEAGISTAEYFQFGPNTATLGVWQKQSLYLSLLCLVSGGFDLTMAASGGETPSGFQLQLSGSADVCGSLGPCPFCVKGCKGISITGTLKTSGIDYHVDY